MKRKTIPDELIGKKIHINGIVQGVGFRPFIYSLAQKHHITGWVRNSSAGVDIVANGNPTDLGAFVDSIRLNPPPLANIDDMQVDTTAPDGFEDFRIVASSVEESGFIPVSPDMAICPDCIRELFDPKDRRFRYPFINCTNCGPRFTIINDIPYDRPLTTMAEFELCESCLVEYHDPLDRRFHAQPVACADCGPHIWFESDKQEIASSEDAIQTAREWLKNGKIIAIKGLGGFHLACDATNPDVIQKLRDLKKRSEKSFAVMVYDQHIAEQYCEMNTGEKELLNSKEKPILILRQKSNSNLPDEIAPGLNTLGVMLPYTPLHYLLLEPETDYPQVLVMTSGNISEEPIAYTNPSAKSELSKIADGFLLNNRDINIRVDDSVIAEHQCKPYFFRRSRGYAPNPLQPGVTMKEILAVGAELKNTFCLTKENYAFLSHHIGNLENLETLNAFESCISHYEHVFKIKPVAIARDLHPDYLSSRYAQTRANAENLQVINVQHHHAHLAACLAENKWKSDAPVIGIIFDGTGLGTDNQIWGGEFLYGNYASFERLAHLDYYPLPGGDSAIRQPKRLAAAYLKQAGIPWDETLPPIQSLDDQERSIIGTQINKHINCPLTSSMGRLFDAVSSLSGIIQIINYEAQAAIELEHSIDASVQNCYRFDIHGKIINLEAVLKAVVSDIKNGLSAGKISAKFHNSVVNMVVEVSQEISKNTGCKTVALSGGVWQNMYLLQKAFPALKAAGFEVLIHHLVPPNDGCIALGQAMIANKQIQ